MLPLLVVSAVAIYFSRDIIIRILFTSEFLDMRELFIWQLAGDVIKLCGWLLAILFLAKKMVKWFAILKAANVEIKLSELPEEEEEVVEAAPAAEPVAEEKPAKKTRAKKEPAEKTAEAKEEKPKKAPAKKKKAE